MRLKGQPRLKNDDVTCIVFEFWLLSRKMEYNIFVGGGYFALPVLY